MNYRIDGKLSSFEPILGADLSPDSESDDAVVTKAEYFYDAFGRRVAKRVTESKKDVYVQSYSHFADQDKILLAKSADGDLAIYLDGKGMDEHLGKVSLKEKAVYETDHLGSVLNSTLAGEHRAYGAFGTSTHLGKVFSKIRRDEAVMYGFTGRQFDPESGFYYYRARMYSPELGRFVSKDPIGFRGGANLYSYVFNNPSLLIDPYGLAAGDAYSSMEAAAIDAAKDAFNASSRANIEYGGVIYFRSADGSYSYTPPVAGTADTFKIPLPLPAGTTALYHSHTPPDAEHGFPETASVEDRMASQTLNIPVYTATPGGNVMKYYDEKEVKTGVCKNAMP